MSDAKVTYYAVVGFEYDDKPPLRELSATTMESAMAEASTLEDPRRVETIHVLGVVCRVAVDLEPIRRKLREEAERKRAEETRKYELQKLAEFAKRYPDEARKLLP